MIIENYKNLIVKKNNIKYPLFRISINNSINIPLIGYVFRIIEGKVECDYWGREIDITKNTAIIIKDNEDKGEIGIYYSNPGQTHFLYRSHNKMTIKILSYKYINRETNE